MLISLLAPNMLVVGRVAMFQSKKSCEDEDQRTGDVEDARPRIRKTSSNRHEVLSRLKLVAVV